MIEFIGNVSEKMRYDTVGDWKDSHGIIFVESFDLGNDDYAFLIMLHELVEAYLCRKHGVKEEIVSAFDIEYEKNRPDGDESEPGDSPDAPYHCEHRAATNIERLMAGYIHVDWATYDKAVCSAEIAVE